MTLANEEALRLVGTKTVRIGIAGSGYRSMSYARAFIQAGGARVSAGAVGGLAAVDFQKMMPGVAVECDVGSLIAREDVDAVVLADPVADLPAVIRRALAADRNVLATISSPVTSVQIEELAGLARKRRRVLMFTEERSFHPALIFLRWMVHGKDGMWQPRYLRAVTAPGAGAAAGSSIGALMVEELAICGRLLGENPTSVSAMVCRVPNETVPAAAFVNLTYGDGRIASLQASTSENQECRQWVLATGTKTVLLDELDSRAPLKIISSESETSPGSLLHSNPPVPLASWPSENTITPPVRSTDIQVDQCRQFVEGVTHPETLESNAEFWSGVARTWEAVQESIRLEGMPVSVRQETPAERKALSARPKLRLIHGKGTGTAGTQKRPALTLVPR
jgi:predicted dehydrogenase